MDVISGQQKIFDIYPEDDDNYLQLQDTDRISYTLYDINGNVSNGINYLPINVPDLENKNVFHIKIPAYANTLKEGETFSQRILMVIYTIKGLEKIIRIPYRIIPFVPYSCTNDDVRSVFGMASTIIEDKMIDIYSGYLKFKSLFEDANIVDTALKSDGYKAVLANRAIVICTALSFKTSLAILVPKIEDNGVASQTRFTMTKEDFDSIFDDLQDELNAIEAEILDEDPNDAYTPDLFVVGNITDTFTGS